MGSYEFHHQGKQAIGLGIASILDMIPISLASHPCWDCSYMYLDVVCLDKDDERVMIIHVSRKKHLNDHAEWIKTRLLREIRDGKTLWSKKSELFPNLQFCESVKEQLQNLPAGNGMLGQIEKKLFNLQVYAQTWVTGIFNSDSIACKVTPESEATLQQYSKERTFLCPDGQERTFSWHARLTPLEWRVYFYPGPPGKIIIGYVGCHLRTTKLN